MAWLLLAAGSARRFGAAKLLSPLVSSAASEKSASEITLIEVAIHNLKYTSWPVFVVVREDDIAMRTLLAGQDVQILPVATQGMGDSIAAGLEALLSILGSPPEAIGIALADMPLVPPDLLRQLKAGADRDGIVRPFYEGSGKAGHPVVFGSRFFDQLKACAGDTGAQAVVAAAGSSLHLVPSTSEGCLIDVDTPADLQRAQALFSIPS